MPIADAGEALGINTRVELAGADRILRARKVRELMLAGVTIESPETVTMDADVTSAWTPSSSLSRRFWGKRAIGENCRVGAYSIVADSPIWRTTWRSAPSP